MTTTVSVAAASRQGRHEHGRDDARKRDSDRLPPPPAVAQMAGKRLYHTVARGCDEKDEADRHAARAEAVEAKRGEHLDPPRTRGSP